MPAERTRLECDKSDLFARFVPCGNTQSVYGSGGKLAGFVKSCWVVVNPPKRSAAGAWRRLSREGESVAG